MFILHLNSLAEFIRFFFNFIIIIMCVCVCVCVCVFLLYTYTFGSFSAIKKFISVKTDKICTFLKIKTCK